MVVFATVALVRAVSRRRRARPAVRTIADAREGLVRFDAVVMPGATIRSPFTGEACAYWCGTLEAFEDRRPLTAIPDSGSWRLVWIGCDGTPFDVRDPTAVARVDPRQGSIEVSFVDERHLDGTVPLDDAALALLAREGVEVPATVRLRYREARVVAGSSVTVCGRMTSTIDPTSTLERLPRQDPIRRAVVAEPRVGPYVRLIRTGL